MARDLEQLLGAGEGVVLETRQHWFVLLRTTIALLLTIVVLVVFVVLMHDRTWWDNGFGDWLYRIVWIGLVATVLAEAWQFFGWYTERFYITTSRVVYARGILNRDVTTTPLVKIEEMTLRRPLLGRLLGYGRLDVDNAGGGSEPLAGLEYLPRPAHLYQVIGERARHQRMYEGGAHVDRDHDGLVDDEGAGGQSSSPADEGETERWDPSGGSTTGD
jgi:uncharacterized membrane protein YdbT with pleckstrin-like domain